MRPLQLLIAEDNPADAELLLRALRKSGFEPVWTRVDTADAFVAALRDGLELVISDYEMPHFNGLRALQLLRTSGREIPFIIVSGTIGEDTAVEAMRQGATDYLLKDRLARLGQAVERALEESRLRRERMQAVEALRLFRLLVDQSNDTFEVIDPTTGRFLDVNEKGPADLGCTRAEYLARRVYDINPAISAERWPQVAENIRRMGTASGESTHRRMDGTVFPIEFSAKWVRLDRDYIVTVVRDITERKRADQKVGEQLAELLRWQEVMLGREDRVQTLKAEVNDLLVRQGAPARYPNSSGTPNQVNP